MSKHVLGVAVAAVMATVLVGHARSQEPYLKIRTQEVLAHAPTMSAAQDSPVPANLKMQIGTSTYLADGRVLAAASDWVLAIDKAVTVYATASKDMCDPRAATLERPATAVLGWLVEITPVRESQGQVDVRVRWQRLGVATKPGNQAVFETTTLSLRAGDRVVVDYGRPDEPGSCRAVGTNLEIGLQAAKTDATVEAELWLVRVNRDGTEKSERQVVRLPIRDSPTTFYFDEARLGAGTIPGTAFLAKVSGELAVFAVTNGKVHFNFKAARRYEKLQLPNADAASDHRDRVAAPSEVVAFQLPAMEVPTFSTRVGSGAADASGFEMRLLPMLSIRVRLQVLNLK